MFRRFFRSMCLLATGAIPLSTVTCNLPETLVINWQDDWYDDGYCCDDGEDFYFDYYDDSYGYVDGYY